MNPAQAIAHLAELAQFYINAQPPSVRGAIGNVAQEAINTLTEATKPTTPAIPTTDEPPKA
jgi:hypothetical protein